MHKSLEEYAAANPLNEVTTSNNESYSSTKNILERRENLAAAERLKDIITEQVKKGTQTQSIVYTAVQCIGLLSNDAEWADSVKAELEKVYSDLAQLSLLQDYSVVEQERLAKMHDEYISSLQASIRQKIRKLERINRDLYSLLETLG